MIREARFEEIEDIISKGKAFEKASGMVTVNVEHSIATFQRLFNEGILTMLVLEEDGKRKGGLAYIRSPETFSGDLMGIELYWFIHPEYRGGGKQLVDAFEEHAIKMGCKKVAMIHMADSYPETLKVFYEKRGYRLTECHYVKEL